jgi:hypothetical protein
MAQPTIIPKFIERVVGKPMMIPSRERQKKGQRGTKDAA